MSGTGKRKSETKARVEREKLEAERDNAVWQRKRAPWLFVFEAARTAALLAGLVFAGMVAFDKIGILKEEEAIDVEHESGP